MIERQFEIEAIPNKTISKVMFALNGTFIIYEEEKLKPLDGGCSISYNQIIEAERSLKHLNQDGTLIKEYLM